MKLFEKTKIGNMKLKNRIVMAPMGTTGEADGAYNTNAIDYFTERAKGGVGLIITGANVVTTKYEARPCTELSNFHHVERLDMLITRCHNYGAKVCVQISPGLGRQQFTDPFTPPYSASECPAFWTPDLICKPFSVADIKYLVEKVGYSASLAKLAGADAVELHAYGGYLLDQFHSKQWNNRTDEYGGSLENRMRFTLECLEAMRKNVGPDFPIFVKFTPNQKVTGFRDLIEGLEMAKILDQSTADVLHLDAGCYEAWYKAITTIYQEPGHQLDMIKEVRKVVNKPLIGQGKLNNPSLAEQVLQDGYLDYIGLGHQLLADPYWPVKVKKDDITDIVPCIGCNECLLAGFSGKHYYCAVNPTCYGEKDFILPKPDGSERNVLIIGGGPAGMAAAITARQRGFKATIWEKADKLGGTLWSAGGPDFKDDVKSLIKYQVNKCKRLGVNIILNKVGTKEEINNGNWDKVIIATGSDPFIPPIPGKDNAVNATEVLTNKVKGGEKVVIIGGGLAGCEAAVYVRQLGTKEATILEMLPDVLFKADHCLNNDQNLRQLLKDYAIKTIGDAKVIKINDHSVVYEKDGQSFTLPCDTVIMAAGFKPNNQLEELEDKVELAIVGDAVAPRKILNAVHEGYHAIRIME